MSPVAPELAALIEVTGMADKMISSARQEAAMAKRRRARARLEAPTCNCLLLCDDVLISQGKNKHNLVGIIGGIAVRELPATLGGYVAYVRLSNVYGSQTVTISIEAADDGEAVLQFEAEFPAQADPLGVYTLVVHIPAFRIERAGRYLFNAMYNDVPFAQSPLEIKLIGGISDDS
jgi:hypothetical protein